MRPVILSSIVLLVSLPIGYFGGSAFFQINDEIWLKIFSGVTVLWSAAVLCLLCVAWTRPLRVSRYVLWPCVLFLPVLAFVGCLDTGIISGLEWGLILAVAIAAVAVATAIQGVVNAKTDA